MNIRLIKKDDYVETKVNSVMDIKEGKIYKERYYVNRISRNGNERYVIYKDLELLNSRGIIPIQDFINLCK